MALQSTEEMSARELSTATWPAEKNTCRPFKGCTGLKVFTIDLLSGNRSCEKLASCKDNRGNVRTQRLRLSYLPTVALSWVVSRSSLLWLFLGFFAGYNNTSTLVMQIFFFNAVTKNINGITALNSSTSQELSLLLYMCISSCLNDILCW